MNVYIYIYIYNFIYIFDIGGGGRGAGAAPAPTIHYPTIKEQQEAERIAIAAAMAEAAERIGAGPLYQAARDLGFGQPTFVDMPGEVAGSLRKPEDWSGATLTSMSRGYGVEVTPLQLAVAYSALANGGLLVRPYVVDQRRDPTTGRVLWAVQPASAVHDRAHFATFGTAVLTLFRVMTGDNWRLLMAGLLRCTGHRAS